MFEAHRWLVALHRLPLTLSYSRNWELSLMGVCSGLYMYDVVVKRLRSLSHLLMSSCWDILRTNRHTNSDKTLPQSAWITRPRRHWLVETGAYQPVARCDAPSCYCCYSNKTASAACWSTSQRHVSAPSRYYTRGCVRTTFSSGCPPYLVILKGDKTVAVIHKVYFKAQRIRIKWIPANITIAIYMSSGLWYTYILQTSHSSGIFDELHGGLRLWCAVYNGPACSRINPVLFGSWWTGRVSAMAGVVAADEGLADCGSARRRPRTTADRRRRRPRVIRAERSPSHGWRPASSTWKERAGKRSVFSFLSTHAYRQGVAVSFTVCNFVCLFFVCLYGYGFLRPG